MMKNTYFRLSLHPQSLLTRHIMCVKWKCLHVSQLRLVCSGLLGTSIETCLLLPSMRGDCDYSCFLRPQFEID